MGDTFGANSHESREYMDLLTQASAARKRMINPSDTLYATVKAAKKALDEGKISQASADKIFKMWHDAVDREWEQEQVADRFKRQTEIARRTRQFNPGTTGLNSKKARSAVNRYNKFWGVSKPQDVKQVSSPTEKILVGAGKTTGVYFTDKPDVKFKQRGIYFDDSKKPKLYILAPGSQEKFGQNLREVGRARETHYIPTKALEKAGSFKKNTYWIHKHDDDGGKPPKVYKDAAGNYIYGTGTLRIGEWMER